MPSRLISVRLFALQDSATKIPVSEAITKGYYVKAKHLATARKIDVHKGSRHVRAFGKEDGKSPAGQDGGRTQFISSLIASWGSKTEQTQAQSGFQPI